MNKQVGGREFARFGFRKLRYADRKSVALRQIAVVSLVFLDKDVVTAPDGRQQGDSQRASYREGQALLAPLGYLFRPQALSLGQGFDGSGANPGWP